MNFFWEFQKNWQPNHSEKFRNEMIKKYLKKIYIYIYIYIYPEEKQKVIDDLTLTQYYSGISKNNKFVRYYTKSTE